MKYLKKYKLFESSYFSNLIDDVRDMTFDLSDNGFDIKISEVNYNPPLYSGSIKALYIRISNDSIFNWDDIKETIERIDDYCWRKDTGYSIDVEVIADDDWMSLDRFVDVYGGEEFSRPGISLLIYSEDDYNSLIEDEEMNESLSNDKYSIFDFYNDLHYHSNKLDQSEVQQWVDHFIGEGWFDRIHRHLTKSWDAMNKVDVEYINDRLYDVWDELPSTKDKWVTTSITYGDYTSIDEPTKRKYNGLMPVSDLKDESRFVMIMKEIIRAILLPTFRIGGWKDEVYIRQDNAEEYVTDEKFQCVNFNIMDYAVVNNSDILIKHKYDLQKLYKYSPENVLDMYVPCLLISIGARDDQHTTINLRKLESGLDEVLPSILPTLEYDEVIFDMTRGDRRYDDDTDISDYKVKILLKF